MGSKTKTVKLIKLNPRSSYFYDPTSGLKLTPGVEVEYTPLIEASKRVRYAVSNQHLMVENGSIEITEELTEEEAAALAEQEAIIAEETRKAQEEADIIAAEEAAKVAAEEALKVKARKVYDDSTAEDIYKNYKQAFDQDTLKEVATLFGLPVTKKMKHDDLIDLVVEEFDRIVELENDNQQ